jgi:hypothetical protein
LRTTHVTMLALGGAGWPLISRVCRLTKPSLLENYWLFRF